MQRLRDAVHRLRVLGQQRQVGGAPADGFEEVDKARDGAVGVVLARGQVERAVHQLVEAGTAGL
ncbi:hypothetical protein D9M68_775130 [compost metagenome]